MVYDIASLIIGPFVGVVLAFVANYGYQHLVNRNTKMKYKDLLRNEVQLSIERLQTAQEKLLPTDRWESLVNSGDLKLFKSDEANKLSDSYFGIRAYNYEAIRCRDVSVQYNLEPVPTRKEQMKKYWSEISWDVDKMGQGVLEDLRKLLSEDWLRNS